MSAPNVACELMMGWWGVGYRGGVRSVMRVMQSSPFVQRMDKIGRAVRQDRRVMPGRVCGCSIDEGRNRVERRLGTRWGEQKEALKGLIKVTMRVSVIRRAGETREEMERAHTHINTCVQTQTSVLTHSQPLQVTLLLSLCKCDCKWSLWATTELSNEPVNRYV